MVPRVNHCIPDANANNNGVLDRITPAKPPTMRPDTPVKSQHLKTKQSGNHVKIEKLILKGG